MTFLKKYAIMYTEQRKEKIPKIHTSPITNQCQPIDVKTEKEVNYDTERILQRNR